MLGAIIGDVIGSVYEWDSLKTKDFVLFTPFSRLTDDSLIRKTSRTLVTLVMS